MNVRALAQLIGGRHTALDVTGRDVMRDNRRGDVSAGIGKGGVAGQGDAMRRRQRSLEYAIRKWNGRHLHADRDFDRASVCLDDDLATQRLRPGPQRLAENLHDQSRLVTATE